MENGRKNRIAQIAVFGGILVAAILIFGTIWTGRSATRDTEKAVRSVSLLYLDELAGRREQVVEDSLNDNINKINIALSLMNDENLKDLEHLQDYQRHMRTLFNLERFGLVNENGLIYTSRGIEHDIEQYPFDLRAISGSEIGVRPGRHSATSIPLTGLHSAALFWAVLRKKTTFWKHWHRQNLNPAILWIR